MSYTKPLYNSWANPFDKSNFQLGDIRSIINNKNRYKHQCDFRRDLLMTLAEYGGPPEPVLKYIEDALGFIPMRVLDIDIPGAGIWEYNQFTQFTCLKERCLYSFLIVGDHLYKHQYSQLRLGAVAEPALKFSLKLYEKILDDNFSNYIKTDYISSLLEKFKEDYYTIDDLNQYVMSGSCPPTLDPFLAKYLNEIFIECSFLDEIPYDKAANLSHSLSRCFQSLLYECFNLSSYNTVPLPSSQDNTDYVELDYHNIISWASNGAVFRHMTSEDYDHSKRIIKVLQEMYSTDIINRENLFSSNNEKTFESLMLTNITGATSNQILPKLIPINEFNK